MVVVTPHTPPRSPSRQRRVANASFHKREKAGILPPAYQAVTPRRRIEATHSDQRKRTPIGKERNAANVTESCHGECLLALVALHVKHMGMTGKSSSSIF